MQDLAGLLGRQRRGRDQGFGELAGPAGFRSKAGALTDSMGEHDGHAGRRQGDQRIDGEPERLQFDRARTDLEGQPGGDAPDPEGRGDAGDQIGMAAGGSRVLADLDTSRRRGRLEGDRRCIR